jgi:hypothetical protein
MCYCDRTDAEILQDLQRGRMPEEALLNGCCWIRICEVRGRNFNSIDPEDWIRICTERGYLFARENPRGF